MVFYFLCYSYKSPFHNTRLLYSLAREVQDRRFQINLPIRFNLIFLFKGVMMRFAYVCSNTFNNTNFATTKSPGADLEPT